jgi:hypothetical protein
VVAAASPSAPQQSLLLVTALERLLRDGGPPMEEEAAAEESAHGGEASTAGPPPDPRDPRASGPVLAYPLAGRCARVARWAADTRLSGGLACLSVLRYLSEHVAALPLSAAVRLLDTHDVMLAMVPLIENPPSVRRCRRVGLSPSSAAPAATAPPTTAPPAAAAAATAVQPRVWRKFVDNAWADVPPGELLRLTPHEAAPWLTLYNLACDPGCRGRYALHSHRKGTLLRVRKYLTRPLLDQVPLLCGLQRHLDETGKYQVHTIYA